MVESLKITVDDDRYGVAVFYTDGYINNQGAEEIARVAYELIDRGQKAIILNLAGTKIVNSIGISILIEIIEKMLEVEGRLAFCSLTPTIEKTFHIMGLGQYAGIYPDEESALANLIPEGEGVVNLDTDGLVVPRAEKAVVSNGQVVLVSATEVILKSLRRDPAEIYDLTPDQFELLICDRLDAMDFEVNRVGKVNSRDGGVDIVSWPKKSAFPFLLAVQAKHRRRAALRIGPGPVKDLKAVLQSSPFDAGLLVTNTSFTPDATWWAQYGPQAVRLRELEDVRRWIMGNFSSEAVRDLPKAIELAPGLTVTVPGHGRS